MPSRPPVSWTRILVPVLLVLTAAAVCGGLYRHERELLAQSWRSREASRTGIWANLLGNHLKSVGEDLTVLADGDGLRAYLSSGQASDLQRAINRASFFSRLRPDYDQIRFLDEEGNEVLRVNRHGAVVPPAQLQNKADRPYFQTARSLERGRIAVSALDLNIENGRIEQPPKPVLRFSSPVFDAAGRRRGVYVINVLAEGLWASLGETVPLFQQRLRLLNAQGYWLKGAHPAQEWGFAFPDRSDATLAKTDPTLWARLLREPAGQAAHAGGSFTWSRLVPREVVAGDHPAGTVAEDAFLVVASEMTAAEWAAVVQPVNRTYAIVAGALLLLLGPAIWSFDSRQQKTTELRRSQQMFQRLFENAPEAILLVDRAGRIVRANTKAGALFRQTPAELTGQNLGMLLPERHRAGQGQQLADYFAAPRATGASLEFSAAREDGGEFPVDITLSPLETEDGPQALAVIRDLTERKRAEQIHLHFRALFESLPGLYLVLKPDLTIAAVSDAYLKATMTKRAEILGRGLFEVFPDNPHDPIATGTANLRDSLDRVRELRTTDTMAIHQYDIRRPDGTFEERFWSLSNSPVVGADGRLEYLIHRVEDVTDFVRQKTTRPENPAELRARMERMEAEIFQSSQKVGAANQELRAVNHELEAFSYSVSHDLRAPLRHIDGFSNLLAKHVGSSLDEKGQRYLDTISNAARQMGRLIDDLLSFSRMGRAELRAQDIDHDALVARVIKEGGFDQPGRPIEWKISPLGRVRADPAMLRQVWFNLIDNAVKYSGKSPQPRIELACSPVRANPGESAASAQEFFVRDNGVGFDMKYVDKLFGVFQRLHGPAEFEGTGIGLANVRRIITRHGGQTRAEGRVGEGATFYFSLPLPAPATGAVIPP